jgi:hypothetical protein
MPDHDTDALFAAVELVGRTGAKGLEVGYLHEDVPVDQAAWYATAQYQGAKVFVENHTGPVEAVEDLAAQLMEGGLCTNCNRQVSLTKHAFLYCRYVRQGRSWIPGCAVTNA